MLSQCLCNSLLMVVLILLILGNGLINEHSLDIDIMFLILIL